MIVFAAVSLDTARNLSACISTYFWQIAFAASGTNCLPISSINTFSQKSINYMN